MMHEEYEELAALEAIGGVTDEESRRLEEHCKGCSSCRHALDDYREAAAGLAIALPPVSPRRDARDSLLIQIQTEAVADSRVAEATEDAAAMRRRTIPSWWSAAAAVLFLALFGWSELRLRALREELTLLETEKNAVITENMRLGNDVQAARSRLDTIRSANQLFRLAASTSSTAASANVFMDATHRRAVIVFTDLEQNDEAHSYQLWIIRGDMKPPMSAGVFDVDADGGGEVELHDMPVDVPIAGLAVTLEPRGGLSAPSGAVLLQGKA
ncbi:MAG: anti-sigma factor [Acidobacteria bacterium]|nr:anti-sigma factor [Acidobacteriota bacterium]